LKASRLEAEVQPTDPSEEADNLQHFAVPYHPCEQEQI
jgi:hypothetical protein